MTYRPPRFLLRRHELMKHLQPGDRFLEIGAGNLFLTRDLALLFDSGVIVEYNSRIRSLLHELPSEIADKLTLVTEDFLIADISGSFDCIVACEVMEHVEDDAAFINKAASMLCQGGQLLLSVPARQKYWSVDDENVGHLRRYERNGLRKTIQDAGLIEIEIFSYGVPLIHLLRFIRVAHAKVEKRRFKKMDNVERSQESGMPRSSLAFQIAGMILNPLTMSPFGIISSFFNKFDLSDGYLAMAKKPLIPEADG